MNEIMKFAAFVLLAFVAAIALLAVNPAQALTVEVLSSGAKIELTDYPSYSCTSGGEAVFTVHPLGIDTQFTVFVVFPDKTAIPGRLSRQGIHMRLDWGDHPRRDSWAYAVLIRPGGEANYYDFSWLKKGETMEPTSHLTCKKVTT